ncbi:ER protein Pkr1-domain-containing protein [Dichotomocladium elegans]|nr:ER protein Pkr1-domain-containing protein [Dichotomocladium elegans]
MSIVDDIVQSILTPGYTANGVIKLMFYAFYMLFATLAIMVVMTRGNIHVIALLLLSICLFITIRWFMAEMDRIKKQSPPTAPIEKTTKSE